MDKGQHRGSQLTKIASLTCTLARLLLAPMLVLMLVLMLALLGGCGASDTTQPTACATGAAAACPCDDGTAGTRTCAGGAWNACQCPVAQKDAGSAADAADTTGGQAPTVKVDFIWMIDHSSSMCQEQRQLAQGLSKFIEALQNYGKTKPTDPAVMDAQMAVVTVQQVPDANEITKIGQFVHKAAKVLPPACIERSKQPCLKDADCTQPQPFWMSDFDVHSSMCPADGKVTAKPLPGPETLAPAKAGDPALPRYFCKQADPTGAPSPYNYNDNCSINTVCQHRCTTDADCYAVFEPDVPDGQHRIKCNKSTDKPGCMFPPESDGCPPPDQLPAVLKQSVAVDITGADGTTYKGTQLDWMRCIATVGANQTPEARFEGGLRSVWTALDPNGINCPKGADGQPTNDCQYKQLVRDDAYLVIVMVSDDDDCSYSFELDKDIGDGTSAAAKDAFEALFSPAVQTACQAINDRTAGNRDLVVGYCELLKVKDKQAGSTPRTCPSDCDQLDKSSAAYSSCQAQAEASLAQIVKDNPVMNDEQIMRNSKFAAIEDFVERFKTLKADPSRVLFAAVTGDTLVDDPVQKSRDRASFYRALLGNQTGIQAPYICQGSRGEAGFGSRYIRVAEAFGNQGVVANICKGADFSQTLGSITDLIVQRIAKDGGK